MDQTVTGYDPSLKFYATRYKQGGRTVFSMDLSLAQVASLLPAPDPTVIQPGNRMINLPHAAGFARYVRSRNDWVVPPIMLRSSNIFEFEILKEVEGTEFGIIAFPRLAMTDLHILDGQHRVLGIHMAIAGVAAELDKARTSMAQARRQEEPDGALDMFRERIQELTAQREKFDMERLAVQIHVVDDQVEFNQMFYDIAEHALGMTSSKKVQFDNTKIVNRVLRAVLFHPLLVDRVDMEKDRLGQSNLNLLSAKHVSDLVRILTVGLDGRVTRRLETELNESDMITCANNFLDLLVSAFPQLIAVADGNLTAPELRATSQLGSPVTIRVLAGLYYELRKQDMDEARIIRYFKRLNGYLSEPATDKWVSLVDGDMIQPGALAPSSRRQDLKAYMLRLVELSEGRKLRPAA